MSERELISPADQNDSKAGDDDREAVGEPSCTISGIEVERNEQGHVAGTVHVEAHDGTKDFDVLWSVTINPSEGVDIRLTAALEEDEALVNQVKTQLVRPLMAKLIEMRSGNTVERATVSDIVIERLRDHYYSGTLHANMEGLETDVCWTVEFGHGELIAEFKPASGGEFEQEVLNRNRLALINQLAGGLDQARNRRLDQGHARDTLTRMHDTKNTAKAARRAQKTGSG